MHIDFLIACSPIIILNRLCSWKHPRTNAPFYEPPFSRMLNTNLRQSYHQKKVINNFKSKIFPIKNLDKTPTLKPAPDSKVFDKPKTTKAKTKCKIFPLKLREDFLSEIKNEEKI